MVKTLLYPAEVNPRRTARLPVERALELAHEERVTCNLYEAKSMDGFPLCQRAGEPLGLASGEALCNECQAS